MQERRHSAEVFPNPRIVWAPGHPGAPPQAAELGAAGSLGDHPGAYPVLDSGGHTPWRGGRPRDLDSSRERLTASAPFVGSKLSRLRQGETDLGRILMARLNGKSGSQRPDALP